MDLNLLIRRTRPPNGAYGRECWLHGFYPAGEAVPILTITDHPGDIVYGGYTYTAYLCSYEPPKVVSDEAVPRATMTVSNVLRSLRPSLEAYDLFRGFTLQSIAYNDLEPAADYTDQLKQMVVIAPEISRLDVTFHLGVPGVLLEEYPHDSYSGETCRHKFRESPGVYGARCGYAAKDIVAINIPGGPAYGRLSVEVTGHGFVTGDLIELSGVTGIAPSLDDVFTVEYFNANVFKLDGTDGADYSGIYTSGGLAGHWWCPQHRLACSARGRTAAVGLQAGLRSDALRLGV